MKHTEAIEIPSHPEPPKPQGLIDIFRGWFNKQLDAHVPSGHTPTPIPKDTLKSNPDHERARCAAFERGKGLNVLENTLKKWERHKGGETLHESVIAGAQADLRFIREDAFPYLNAQLSGTTGNEYDKFAALHERTVNVGAYLVAHVQDSAPEKADPLVEKLDELRKLRDEVEEAMPSNKFIAYAIRAQQIARKLVDMWAAVPKQQWMEETSLRQNHYQRLALIRDEIINKTVDAEGRPVPEAHKEREILELTALMDGMLKGAHAAKVQPHAPRRTVREKPERHPSRKAHHEKAH